MYRIATLNKISAAGLARLTDRYGMTDDISEAHGILVRSHDMHGMAFSKGLLAIARAGAGVNNIPVERCSSEGIVVFNTPGANANAVKELVLTGLLMSARNLTRAIAWTKTLTDDVTKVVEKNKSQFAGEEIKGKTLGVIGLGFIGVLVANAAELLGMRVVGYDPYISVKSAHELSHTVKIYDTLDDVLPKCDYITIHVPFMENTLGMFNEKSFSTMKDGVVLLNFSRDMIVRDADVLRAVKDGKVRNYVTDFPTEQLINVENVICIPHLGASTRESEENCAVMAVDEIMDYLENGNITHSVNFPKCNMGAPTTPMRVCILNRNIPAMLQRITGALAGMGANINDMLNRSKDEYAYTLVDIDSCLDEDDIRQALRCNDGIVSIRVIYRDRARAGS
ncbi:MAG: 3-phosphoglycerate dehydrogenase [Clostridiales Family XIII bacterium]|jgi:D-3-phosphoglycerate dehydrogenase|nr:3-phosphoglycerate dehydrogenase [Clostridiales Family XIII bacterium]